MVKQQKKIAHSTEKGLISLRGFPQIKENDSLIEK